MKILHSTALRATVCIVLLGATGLVSACAEGGSAGPLDVGSMALPTSSQPAASITYQTSRATAFDTGNMAYPEPLPQGVISRTTSQVRYPDTGNMAFPSPRPQGDLGGSPR